MAGDKELSTGGTEDNYVNINDWHCYHYETREVFVRETAEKLGELSELYPYLWLSLEVEASRTRASTVAEMEGIKTDSEDEYIDSGEDLDRHAPKDKGRLSDWEAYPGTNMDPAKKGIKDPRLFTFVRRKKNDHTKVQYLHYPRDRAGLMDWNNGEHILALNKWRRQLYVRVGGEKKQYRLPWTKTEYDVLLILAMEKRAANQHRLNKSDLTSLVEVFNNDMRNIDQPQGTPLARSIVHTDSTTGRVSLSKKGFLTSARDSHIDRSVAGVQNQVKRFQRFKKLFVVPNGVELPEDGWDTDTTEEESDDSTETSSTKNATAPSGIKLILKLKTRINDVAGQARLSTLPTSDHNDETMEDVEMREQLV